MTKQRPGRPRVRLFVALELPPRLVEQIDSWREAAYSGHPAVRLPAAATIHVTLVFLGYQYERDVDRITEHCFSDAHEPFGLQVKDLVAVPPRRPRLHALDLEDRGNELAAWQGGIAARLAEQRLYKPEKRPFWPHITIARVKRGREREAAEGGTPDIPKGFERPFRANRVTLFRSTLARSGAIYEPLAAIDLV